MNTNTNTTPELIPYSIQSYHMQNDPHNYNYTFYSSSTSTSRPQLHSNYTHTWEEPKYKPSTGTFTTMFTPTVSSKLVEPPPVAHIEPEEREDKPKSSNYGYYGTASSSRVGVTEKFEEEQSKPVTFPYKDPKCGVNISGKSGFEIKGNHVTLKIDKVANTRQGGQSGTLQFHLIRMSYFHDGHNPPTPEQYTSVCTAQLGQLEGGYSFNDIVRGGVKREDESGQWSFRKCYVLLLEEYSEGRYTVVDYVNFD